MSDDLSLDSQFLLAAVRNLFMTAKRPLSRVDVAASPRVRKNIKRPADINTVIDVLLSEGAIKRSDSIETGKDMTYVLATPPKVQEGDAPRERQRRERRQKIPLPDSLQGQLISAIRGKPGVPGNALRAYFSSGGIKPKAVSEALFALEKAGYMEYGEAASAFERPCYLTSKGMALPTKELSAKATSASSASSPVLAVRGRRAQVHQDQPVSTAPLVRTGSRAFIENGKLVIDLGIDELAKDIADVITRELTGTVDALVAGLIGSAVDRAVEQQLAGLRESAPPGVKLFRGG